jgi:hypothetical protein
MTRDVEILGDRSGRGIRELKPLDTIRIDESRYVLLKRVRGYLAWVCFAILAALRSSGYPSAGSIGVCLGLELITSSAALLYLVATQSAPKTADGDRNTAIYDDVRVRILVFGLSSIPAVISSIDPGFLPYLAVPAAAIALGCRILQRVLGIAARNVESYLGTDLIRDIFLSLLLFVFGYDMILGRREEPQMVFEIAIWALVAATGIRFFALRASWAARRGAGQQNVG